MKSKLYKKSTHINLWQSIDLNIIRTLSKNVNILTFIVRKFKYIQVNKLKKIVLGMGQTIKGINKTMVVWTDDC